MSNCETEADWGSIVEDVHPEPLEAGHLGEAIDDIGDAIEWLSEGKRRNWKYENC